MAKPISKIVVLCDMIAKTSLDAMLVRIFEAKTDDEKLKLIEELRPYYENVILKYRNQDNSAAWRDVMGYETE